MEALIGDLERIYRSSFVRFVCVAAAISGDEGSGADAVHDAFVACVRGAGGFRGEGSLEAWVWTSVVNSARRIRRDRRRAADVAVSESGQEMNGHGGEFAGVRAALALLPERQRLVLFLRYYADLDYRAIADVLDIAVGTVGSALNQAHASLRASLSEEVAE
jgi:RNA polymerase sigma-70 factor (ECF subfamily)